MLTEKNLNNNLIRRFKLPLVVYFLNGVQVYNVKTLSEMYNYFSTRAAANIVLISETEF